MAHAGHPISLRLPGSLLSKVLQFKRRLEADNDPGASRSRVMVRLMRLGVDAMDDELTKRGL